jgi:hypothetical protein
MPRLPLEGLPQGNQVTALKAWVNKAVIFTNLEKKPLCKYLEVKKRARCHSSAIRMNGALRYLLVTILALTLSPMAGAQTAKPHYPDATYGGETVTLTNGKMQLAVYKRSTGWGWVEISNAAGELIAVLDHFGEVSPEVAGRWPVPVRIEAQRYTLEKGDFGQRLTFPVHLVWYEAAVNTGFPSTNPATRIGFSSEGLSQPALGGTFTITLAPEAAIATIHCDLTPLKALGVYYLRGPWLKVGAGSFGAAKTDGIFPGVEWITGNEWSSGTDWMQHPLALRVVPHPFKVTAPVMAMSWNGTGIGLAWNPLQVVMNGQRYLQPVYASPNFIDRANNHIMGLVLPSVAAGAEENAVPVHQIASAEHVRVKTSPIVLLPGSPIKIDAEIFLIQGNSLDVFVDWVKRHGLPEPPKPRYSLREAMNRLVRQYSTTWWHEGRGWGRTINEATADPPLALEPYAGPELAAKIAWGRSQIAASGQFRSRTRSGVRAVSLLSREAQLTHGRNLMVDQRQDGSFPIGTQGERGRYANYINSVYKPLGLKKDFGIHTFTTATTWLATTTGARL